jgi:hypothetical protein
MDLISDDRDGVYRGRDEALSRELDGQSRVGLGECGGEEKRARIGPDRVAKLYV